MDRSDHTRPLSSSPSQGGEYFRQYIQAQQREEQLNSARREEAQLVTHIREQYEQGQIDRTRQEDILDLERPLPVKPSTITFHTDTGRKIERDAWPDEWTTVSPVSLQEEIALLRDSGLENKVRIIEHANPRYNCHGYTFTHGEAGHIGIVNHEDDIEDILRSKNYRDCDDARPPQRGDIVIYRNGNDKICHSGVISRIDGDKIFAISKWSMSGLYEHDIEDYLDAFATSLEVLYTTSIQGRMLQKKEIGI